MSWSVCCLGYRQVQTQQAHYRCQGCPQVVQVLSEYPLSWGRARWHTGVDPGPDLNLYSPQQEAIFLLFSRPSTTSKENLLGISPPTTFYPWKTPAHFLMFPTFLIIAPVPTWELLWSLPASPCYSLQLINLRALSPAHSRRKMLHWGGLGDHKGDSQSMKSKMTTFIFREEINELSDLPHFSPREHSSSPAHPLLLIDISALVLAVNDSAWIPEMYGLWWEGGQFRLHFMYFSLQEKNGLADLVFHIRVEWIRMCLYVKADVK